MEPQIQQIVDYIKNYQAQGYKLPEILDSLKKQGVSKDLIQTSLNYLNSVKEEYVDVPIKNESTVSSLNEKRVTKVFYIFLVIEVVFILLESLTSYLNENVFGNFENIGLMGIPLMPVYLLGQLVFLVGGVMGIIGIIWGIKIYIKKKLGKHAIALILPSLILLGSTAIMPENLSVRDKVLDPVVHSVISEKQEKIKGKNEEDIIENIKNNYEKLQNSLDANGGQLKVVDAYHGEIYLEGGQKIHSTKRRKEVKWDSFVQYYLLGKEISVKIDPFENYEYKNMKAEYESKPDFLLPYDAYIEQLGKVKTSVPVIEIKLGNKVIGGVDFDNFDITILDLEKTTPNFQNFYGWNPLTKQFKSSKNDSGYGSYFNPK